MRIMKVVSLGKVLLTDMNWPELERRLKETDMVIVPVGSTEQHGPILPLKTDAFIVNEIARRAAEAVETDVKAVVAPSVPFGYSPGWLEWPGTISLRGETFRNLIIDMIESLRHHGFRKIVILNGHGTNPPLLWQIMNETNRTKDIMLVIVNWYELVYDVYEKVIERKVGGHAEELETSMILALGEKVDIRNVAKYVSELPFAKFQKPHSKASTSLLYYQYAQPVYYWRQGEIRRDNPSGVVGDATMASREKGEKILFAAVDRLAEFLRELKGRDLKA